MLQYSESMRQNQSFSWRVTQSQYLSEYEFMIYGFALDIDGDFIEVTLVTQTTQTGHKVMHTPHHTRVFSLAWLDGLPFNFEFDQWSSNA